VNNDLKPSDYYKNVVNSINRAIEFLEKKNEHIYPSILLSTLKLTMSLIDKIKPDVYITSKSLFLHSKDGLRFFLSSVSYYKRISTIKHVDDIDSHCENIRRAIIELNIYEKMMRVE
jgi:hypothetical protein